MRVLVVESQTEMGGAQFALLTLLESLNRACIAPVFASLGFGQGDFPERITGLGIPVHRIPGGRFRELRSTTARIGRLRKLIQEEKAEVVLSNSAHPLLYARPAALLAGRPCVWWVHGWEPTDPLRGNWINLVESCISADAMLANSEFTAGVLRQAFSTHGSIRVARYGIDLQRYHPDCAKGALARQSLGISDGTPVVGMFGRLQRWKGQHIFLRAAALLASHEKSCRFLIVGGSPFGLEPAYAEELKQMVQHAGLGERVMFLGQRSDTNELLNACDVVVHASVEPEPWGLVVAEAMAAGRAVIAAAAGGPLEMIEHGRTGLLVPPGDASALAEAMELLVQNAEQRRALGVAARRHAEQHFERHAAAAHMCEELRRAREAYARRT
jgi:glycosyltransferase involved in cell wall biosynthesis